jgi:rare lipoprotein A
MNVLTHRYLILGALSAGVFGLGPYGSVAVSGEDIEPKTEVIAEKVEKKALQTEKAEGKNDLVKDQVEVKVNAKDEAVIEQKGEASWYGKGFHGKKTASGEKFDQDGLTAAHPTLPLGTEVTVTNLETGKSVDVEITDRGPYTKGRDLDLSKKAAKEIDMTEDGAAPVEIEAKVPSEDRKKDAQ